MKERVLLYLETIDLLKSVGRLEMVLDPKNDDEISEHNREHTYKKG